MEYYEIAEIIEQQVGKDQNDNDRRRRSLEKQIREIEETTERIISHIDAKNASLVNSQLYKLNQERLNAESQLNSLRSQHLSAAVIQEMIDDTLATVHSLPSRMTSDQLSERASVARLCVAFAEIDFERSEFRVGTRVLPSLALLHLGVETLTTSL